MPAMSEVEQIFCRSRPWRGFARRVVLPWSLGSKLLEGEVLELGGGSGAMAEGLLQRFPKLRLTVTDYDEDMVTAASARLRRFGDRVRVQQADATNLPFGDASFDAVLSFIMLHHVIDWERGLAEAVRVLRPGGAFIGYDLTDSAVARLIHRLDRSPHRLFSVDEMRAAVGGLSVDGEVRKRFGSRIVQFRLERQFPSPDERPRG